MDRRTFLKATSACAATAATATAASAATNSQVPSHIPDTAQPTPAEVLNLHLHLPWPDNLAGPSDQARRLARDIKSVSNGRLVIEIDTPQASSIADADNTGTDLFFGVLHTRKNAPKASLFFSGLPHAGGLSAPNLEGWLSIAGGQPLWDDLVADMGIKPILAGHLGEMPGLWSKTPIRSITDLAERRVAATSTTPDVLRTIGAIPVSTPPEELKRALADGTIDVVEYGGLQTAMSLGLHEVANHLNRGILNPTGTALTLAVPNNLWQSLSEADRAIITTCANQNYRLTCTENRAQDIPLTTALRDRHGVEIFTSSKDDNKSWQRITDTFLAHVSGANERAKRISASYSAFKNISL